MKHPDKILTMTKFVLWLQDNLHLFWNATKECYDTDRAWHLTINYAELLQTPLSLEMFVAVKDGKILEEPGQIDYFLEYRGQGKPIASHDKRVEFKQAHKKILFEECEILKQEMGRPTCFKIEGETIARLGTYKNATVEWLNGVSIESLIDFMNITGTENFWRLIFR